METVASWASPPIALIRHRGRHPRPVRPADLGTDFNGSISAVTREYDRDDAAGIAARIDRDSRTVAADTYGLPLFVLGAVADGIGGVGMAGGSNCSIRLASCPRTLATTR